MGTYRNTSMGWSPLIDRTPLLFALRLRPTVRARATPTLIMTGFLMKSILYLGGHTAGDSTKARKNNVRLARDIAMGHQVNMGARGQVVQEREHSNLLYG